MKFSSTPSYFVSPENSDCAFFLGTEREAFWAVDAFETEEVDEGEASVDPLAFFDLSLLLLKLNGFENSAFFT